MFKSITGSSRRVTCRLFHDWPRWGIAKVGNALRDGKRVGDFVHQERTCRRCGKTEIRQIA